MLDVGKCDETLITRLTNATARALQEGAQMLSQLGAPARDEAVAAARAGVHADLAAASDRCKLWSASSLTSDSMRMIAADLYLGAEYGPHFLHSRPCKSEMRRYGIVSSGAATFPLESVSRDTSDFCFRT